MLTFFSRVIRLFLVVCLLGVTVVAAGAAIAPQIADLKGAVSGEAVTISFTPHLLPMIRGIHATVYADARNGGDGLQSLFENYYQNEPFVDVMPACSHPETRSVRVTNVLDLSAEQVRDFRAAYELQPWVAKFADKLLSLGYLVPLRRRMRWPRRASPRIRIRWARSSVAT